MTSFFVAGIESKGARAEAAYSPPVLLWPCVTGCAAPMIAGEPSLRRDVERLFSREIAKGLSSQEAALAVGASSAAGSRWFRERGGMPTFMLASLSGRYLSFEEREQASRAFPACRRLPCTIAADLQAELSLRWTGPRDRGGQAAVQGRRRRGCDSRPWAPRGLPRPYRRRRQRPARARQSSRLLIEAVVQALADA